MAINRFECVLSTLLHEEPPITPQVLSFTNEMSRVKFVPIIEVDIAEKTIKFENEVRSALCEITAAGLKRIEKTLKIAEYMDNFIVEVGGGGIKARKVIKTEGEWSIVEWETGAKWRVGSAKTIWARQYIDYPVKTEDDLENLELPDPDDPA
ncbi:hypothetical protein J7L29_07370 [Candidatus Bathyarchaeota archaeon]|nr:hypothetical protein [Candidatus Bathyarchaeota archaeon]